MNNELQIIGAGRQIYTNTINISNIQIITEV